MAQRIAFLMAAFAVLLWSISEPESRTADAPAALPETAYVALTFDDGPRSDTTGRLLDGLLVRGASATFFLVGEQIVGNEALVQRMEEEGHQVGNHSWSHQNLEDSSCETVLREIGKTDALLREILGQRDYWVRPPYGLLEDGQRALFSVPLVHWSVDPEDWKKKNADKDVEAVLSRVQPGDVILMHDSIPESVDAALRIVDQMTEQGYLFVTVEELLALYDRTAAPGQIIRSAQ